MYKIRFFRVRRDQYGEYIDKQHSFYRTFNTLSEAARYLMVNDEKLLIDAFSLTKRSAVSLEINIGQLQEKIK